MSYLEKGSVIEAIKAINPNAGCSVVDNDPDRITWDNESDVVSKADILAKIEALQYYDKRKAEYPTIEELVVALYDTDDKSAIEAKRAEIKLKYPKNE